MSCKPLKPVSPVSTDRLLQPHALSVGCPPHCTEHVGVATLHLHRTRLPGQDLHNQAIRLTSNRLELKREGQQD